MYMMTPEQIVAVQTIKTGIATRLIAFAGAGKTSTLSAAAKLLGTRGVYIAFNKSIATEAESKFPRSTWCKTSHGLARKDVAGKYGFSDDKMSRSAGSRQLGSMLARALPDGINPSTYASVVVATVRAFCQSWDDKITAYHVPALPGLSDELNAEVSEIAVRDAARVWQQMIDPGSHVSLGHDGYMKLWALDRPRLRFDYIMLDEAQDTAQVLIGVLRNQLAQVISVGDPHQAIYEWRGARNALAILPGTECRLTQSFRFGSTIAHAANRVLLAMGEQHPLRGASISDSVSSPLLDTHDHVDAILCRTNAGVIGHAADSNRRVFIPGGVNDLLRLVEDAERLKNHDVALGLELAGFQNWREVEEFVKTDEGKSLASFVNLVGKYGVRTLKSVLGGVLAAPEPGCVTISTAHKGKGMEWSSVLLNEDFAISDGETEGGINMAERRLFYVAMTRAKHRLFVDGHTLEAYSRAEEI